MPFELNTDLQNFRECFHLLNNYCSFVGYNSNNQNSYLNIQNFAELVTD